MCSGRNPPLRAADASTVPLRQRGAVGFEPRACRTLAGMQARALPLRQQCGRRHPRCRIGREPSVSQTVARLLLASENSEARAAMTLLVRPRAATVGIADESVRRLTEVVIAFVALQQCRRPSRGDRFPSRACRRTGSRLAVGGPVGDEEDFRCAAVSVPLVAKAGLAGRDEDPGLCMGNLVLSGLADPQTSAVALLTAPRRAPGAGRTTPPLHANHSGRPRESSAFPQCRYSPGLQFRRAGPEPQRS